MIISEMAAAVICDREAVVGKAAEEVNYLGIFLRAGTAVCLLVGEVL